MRRRSNAGFFERLQGPSSVSYRGELQKRRAQARKDARERKHQERLEAQRDREAKKEEIRREREQIREANKLKRQLLKEEKAERKAEARQREQERAERAIPSAAAIERAYKRGAKTLGEAMEMARGNPGRMKENIILYEGPSLETARVYLKNAIAVGRYVGLRMGGRKGHWRVTADSVRNPRGSKGKFERCVKSVAARGGARDPKAVCGAMEKKLPNASRKTEGDYALYTDAGLVAWGISLKRAKTMARKIKYGSATIATTSGRTVQTVKRDKRNPADGAVEAYEIFHGRKPEEFVTIAKQRHYHKHLAAAGELERLVIETPDGRAKVTLSQFDGALLAFNEQALKELAKKGKVKLTQLFIEGGDQSVDLEDFGIDPDNVHEIETLGKAVKIDYFTTKDHLGGEGGTAVYGHKFRTTNENGKHVTVRIAKYPDVIYRVRDNQLEFSGGSYEIRAEGIDK